MAEGETARARRSDDSQWNGLKSGLFVEGSDSPDGLQAFPVSFSSLSSLPFDDVT
ncbi:hypothetical protein SAMN04488000_101737 [Lentzea albida]|uniref:Uncharacterized protein n=1 Tax=Lentzea albida TaxID=65499 RepID=A0A1H9BY36_9PSEU|nr:hypothetical protein SAMN04488000_101737 [Lentzea albida]